MRFVNRGISRSTCTSRDGRYALLLLIKYGGGTQVENFSISENFFTSIFFNFDALVFKVQNFIAQDL